MVPSLSRFCLIKRCLLRLRLEFECSVYKVIILKVKVVRFEYNIYFERVSAGSEAFGGGASNLLSWVSCTYIVCVHFYTLRNYSVLLDTLNV